MFFFSRFGPFNDSSWSVLQFCLRKLQVETGLQTAIKSAKRMSISVWIWKAWSKVKRIKIRIRHDIHVMFMCFLYKIHESFQSFESWATGPLMTWTRTVAGSAEALVKGLMVASQVRPSSSLCCLIHLENFGYILPILMPSSHVAGRFSRYRVHCAIPFRGVRGGHRQSVESFWVEIVPFGLSRYYPLLGETEARTKAISIHLSIYLSFYLQICLICLSTHT